MDENTQRKPTFDEMPDVLSEIQAELRIIRKELREIMDPDGKAIHPEHIPVGIERASEITGKAVNTLYRYTSQNLIPYYKKGKTVLFFEDELLQWLREGKIETLDERASRTGSRIVMAGNRR